jgi:hypothetical protein
MRVAVLALVALLISCSGRVDPAVGECRATLLRHVWDRSRTEALDEFTQLNPDLQYRVFICANQYGEPPLVGFGVEQLASQGDRIVPILISRLEESESEKTMLNLLTVFAAMQRNGAYDVRGDLRLMALLDAKVAEVQGRSFSAVARGLIAEIKGVE